MNEMLLAQMLAASDGRNHFTDEAPMLGPDHCCALGAMLLASGVSEMPPGQTAKERDQAGFALLVSAGYDANFLAGVNDGYEDCKWSLLVFHPFGINTDSIAYQYGQELGAAYREAVSTRKP